MKKILEVFTVFLLLFLVSCEKEDNNRVKDTNYNPVIDPVNFAAEVNNAYFPLDPGEVYTYTSHTAEGTETDIVSILAVPRMVDGVNCTVVHDSVSLDGKLIEDTYDWYAQDVEGNVWYFGEDVSNYENGVFQDKEGSFESGVDGAKPGIIMMSEPVIELPYRQEYYFNVAEDWGKVVAKGMSVTTPYGSFTDCLKTVDWNFLEPDAPLEYKYYAPGIGLVKEEVEGTGEVSELITIAFSTN